MLTPKRYTKRPVTIEAMQLTGAASRRAICEWVGLPYDERAVSDLLIPTLEGTMCASLGDYVVRGVKGEFYPVKPDIFDTLHVPAEDE